MTVGAIFAGGMGKRLHPLTENAPKVMVEIKKGMPLLEFNLLKMKEGGIEEIYLMVGHLGDVIRDHFGDSWEGMSLHYLKEKRPMGTLWAVSNLLGKISDEDLLLMNGDVVSDISMRAPRGPAGGFWGFCLENDVLGLKWLGVLL